VQGTDRRDNIRIEEETMAQRLQLGKRLKDLFGRGRADEEFFEELEELLLQADIGPQVTMELADELRRAIKQERLKKADEFIAELKKIMGTIIKTTRIKLEPDKLNIFLVLGVNGVGKTTSIAKLAHYLRGFPGKPDIMLSAADTFRAAAVDQLKLWGQRLGLKVIHQAPGADPGAVVFDSIDAALARKSQALLIDTSGRMHNKENLVRELSKIDKIVGGKLGGNRYHKLLVIDATTGQNALRQAEVFHQVLTIDSVMLAKYDSAAKGGMVVSLCRQLGLAFSFLGIGEKPEDLRVFDTAFYLDSLLGG
jgi:fused signal recognition particle receptor